MGLIRGNSNNGQLGREEDLVPSDEAPAFVEGKTEVEQEEVVIPGEGAIENPEKPTVTATPEKPVEEKPAFTFKTQAELDAIVESKIKSTTTPTPTDDEEEEDETFKDLTIFKGHTDPETGKWVGEVPADWNDLARKILAHLSPKEYAPKVLKVIQNMTAKERKEMETIGASFDAEMDEMAAQGLIPSRTTEEGKKVDAQISTLGGKYNLTSMKDAYNLWKQIPVANGGGLDYKPGTTPTAPTRPKNPNKEVARMVGSSSKTTTAKPGAKTMSYAKLHSARSVDELLEED
jgi:hypothetical protein